MMNRLTDKQKFIMLFMDDYVKMAYRQLTKKIDLKKEQQLAYNIYYLLDEYPEGTLSKYIYDETIL